MNDTLFAKIDSNVDSILGIDHILELIKLQDRLKHVSWNSTMMSKVTINDKIVTQTGQHAYCYLGIPLYTDNQYFKISWSFKITKRLDGG